MLRFVSFTRSAAETEALLRDVQWGFSLFVLIIDFVPPTGELLWLKAALAPTRGYYRMRCQIKYRSPGVAAMVARHKLASTLLFEDEPGRERAQHSLEVAKTSIDGAPTEFMAIAWPLLHARAAYAKHCVAGVVTLTLNNLAKGVEVAGRVDELRQLQFGVTGAVDRTHSQLLFALSFDRQETLVIAPGSPQKAAKDKPVGKPPSTWS